MRKYAQIMFSAMGITALVAVWEIIALKAPTLVPHVWKIMAAVADLALDPTTRLDFFKTFVRTLIAFSIAVSLGVPIGIAIGSLKPFNMMFSGPMNFLRSLPAFVLLPLFLVFFKSGEAARIAMAAFGAGLVIAANTAFGTAHVGRLRIEVARVYGASRSFILFNVIGREVMPQALDGMRLAISLSLVLTIVSEIMLGATYGLGTRVNDSLSGFQLPRMYALIFLIGAMGHLLNIVGQVLSERIASYGRHL